MCTKKAYVLYGILFEKPDFLESSGGYMLKIYYILGNSAS